MDVLWEELTAGIPDARHFAHVLIRLSAARSGRRSAFSLPRGHLLWFGVSGLHAERLV